MTTDQQYDSKAEEVQKPEDIVKYWMRELNASAKREQDWRKKGKRAEEVYAEEKEKGGSSFNILWANTEIMLPNLYSNQPIPDIRRRPVSKADPIAKAASEMLEDALKTYMDEGDFDEAVEGTVTDYMIPGRGVTRVRFVPTMIPVPPMVDESGQPVGEPGEKLVDMKLEYELVNWQDYRRGAGKRWKEVSWEGFRHYFTKDEFRENFPGIKTDDITFEYHSAGEEGEGDTKKPEEQEVFTKAEVWEIWDKSSRKVFWVAKCYEASPLKTEEDPLELKGFFPNPQPLIYTNRTDSLNPVCPFDYYKRQAKELDQVSDRINKMMDGMKLRGIYDKTMAEVERLLDGADNEMIPAESAAIAMENGGLDKAIWFLPIEQIAKVVANLYVQRDQIKQVIYELTGQSDIARGASDPNETLGAQQLKVQTGGLRLQRAQKKVQRYCRDLIRISAEIIGQNITPEILQEISGKQLRPEEIQRVMQILRTDRDRMLNIDVETDSTIAADEARDRQQLGELFQGLSSFIGAVGPAVEQGALTIPVATKMLKSVIRRFKMGREVEEELDQAEMEQQQQGAAGQQKPDPKAEAEMQKTQGELQIKAQSAQADQQLKQQESQAKLQGEMAKGEQELQLKREEMAARLQMEKELEMMRMQMQERMEVLKIDSNRAVEMMRIEKEPNNEGISNRTESA